MTLHSGFTKLLFVTLVVSLLASCAPMKPYVLTDYQRDPEFVLIEMLATGLVLGGVTVTAFPVTVEERNAITAQLEDVLTQFSFYKYNTPMTLARRVSEEKYEQIMAQFEKHQTISGEDINYLKSVYTPARYVLFVNIDNNQVLERTVHSPDSIEFQTVRTIDATLNIISLQTAKPALFTRIRMNDVNTNSIPKLTVRAGAGVFFGSIVAQATFGDYPEPPPTQQTLYRVFLAVADQVPHS